MELLSTLEQNNVYNTYTHIAKHFSATREKIWPSVIDFYKKLENNSLILDAGCGNGKNMYRDDCYYTGADACIPFLEEMISKKTKDYIGINVKMLPFKNATYDYVLSVAVLHHIYSYEDRVGCIQEMIRVTRPGGKIFISVWSKNKNHDYGDTFIDWTLQKKYSRENTSKIYKRYYHLFKLTEIETLIKDADKDNKVNIESCYESFNNIYTILSIYR